MSRSRSAGKPAPVRSKSKSCGSEAGSVTFTTVNDACLVFVNTHVIVSPDCALNVAVLPASLEFGAIVSPEQVMSVSDQPAGTVSVAV